jgi:hypothetical protein
MKSITLFLSLLLIGAMTLPASAQRSPVEKKSSVTKKTVAKKPATKKSAPKKSIAKKSDVNISAATAPASTAPASTAGMLRQAGRPFMDTTADGLHMKVWILTQSQNRKLLGGQDGHRLHGETATLSSDNGRKSPATGSIRMFVDAKTAVSENKDGGKSLVDSMMAGTHHIMVVVKDMPGEQELPDAGASVVIISPSEKTSTVDLAPLAGRLGAGISLREKGSYHMTLSVFDNGVTITKEFTYFVR